MRKLFLLLLLPLSVAAQNNASVRLTCKFVNCSGIDSLNLYSFQEGNYKVVGRAGRSGPDSAYVFTIPTSKSRFYSIGQSESVVARVILGEESAVTLWGNCAMLNYSRTVGSPINKAFEQTVKRFDAFTTQEQAIKNSLASARQTNNAAATTNASDRLLALSKSKIQFLDSLKTTAPLLGLLAGLAVHPEFEADGKGKYGNEADFIGHEFFKYADFNNPAYNEFAEVGESFKTFATLMTTTSATAAQQKEWAEAQLNKLAADSKMRRLALVGLVGGFQAANSPNYIAFAESYVRQYKGKDNGDAARMEFEINRSRTYTPGMEAPDLIGEALDGSKKALSNLRGKYVLVDFWASWCGPCRREMPNVKASYEKYKNKGFEIFGVSLDRDKAAWQGATDAEGITWPQISDLRGWQSQHAQLYSVQSIPQTVLLDKEGKIIVRNLRGGDLDAKLKELFGE